MEFPDSVYQAVNAACTAHPNNIPQATEDAVVAIQSLPEYTSLVDKMVRSAIQQLVYSNRHQVNVDTRNQIRGEGGYGGPAKVKTTSATINGAYRSAYLYHIGGTTLGSICGEQLVGLAEQEERVAGGHLFNANLCRRLRAMVRDGQRVDAVVSEKKLRNLFRELKAASVPAA